MFRQSDTLMEVSRILPRDTQDKWKHKIIVTKILMVVRVSLMNSIELSADNRQSEFDILKVSCLNELWSLEAKTMKLSHSIQYKHIQEILLRVCFQTKSFLLNEVLVLIIILATVQDVVYYILLTNNSCYNQQYN